MQTLIGLHTLWRWVVLLAVAVALVRGVIGWLRGGAWTSNDRLLVLLAVSALDIQLILGLLTYGGTKSWNAGTFIAYIHPLVMLGRHRDRARHQQPHPQDDRRDREVSDPDDRAGRGDADDHRRDPARHLGAHLGGLSQR